MRNDAIVTEERPAMKPAAKIIFDAAFQQARQVPEVTAPDVEPIGIQIKRSLTAQAIAALLSELAQAEVGIPTEKRLPLSELHGPVRERCVLIGEVAVKRLDPDFRVRVADETVVKTLEWLEGPYDGEIPTEEECCRKAIAFYCQTEDTER